MIHFDAVSKTFGSVSALRDVSFTVRPGDIFGYIGPNGAGKTTSIKLMTGLIRDFHGGVSVDGIVMGTNNQPLPASVGYLPQESGFQEWRTVDHVLTTFGRLSGLSGSGLSARINNVLALLGLGELRSRKVAHLSGGTVQKLRLAQALLGDPKILILDEPLSGLDPTSRFQVKNLIRGFADRDRVVFLSSHILSDVEDLATRIGILHHGTVREVGTPSELRNKHQLGVVIEVVAATPEARDAISAPDELFEKRDEVGGETLRFHARPGIDPTAAFHSILSPIVADQIPIRSARHLQPSLEDVYLELTEAAR